MKTRTTALALIVTCAALAGTSGCSSTTSGSAAPQAATAPTGLRVGDRAPAVELVGIDRTSQRLPIGSGPVVVTFYRGGWCPYCTKALAGWEAKLTELTKAGATVVAITMEKPEQAAKTVGKTGATYTVLCDPSGAAAEAYRLKFAVDDRTRRTYSGYGIDVAANNSNGLWELPVPATFVLDKEGVVRFAHVDADYTKRANVDEVVAMVRAMHKP